MSNFHGTTQFIIRDRFFSNEGSDAIPNTIAISDILVQNRAQQAQSWLFMSGAFELMTRLFLYLCLILSCLEIGHSAGGQVIADRAPQANIARLKVEFPTVDRADIRFMRFYTIEGPSKSNAGPFVQDDQGFVWFGSPYGLNRFDGYNFKIFTHDPANPKSISGSLVTGLFKDRNGVLWVGCNHSLNRFNSETETFRHYRVPYVFHISQDAAGTLWLSTPTGLYSLDPVNETVRRYTHDPNDPTSLKSNHVKSTGEDKNREFWVATSEGLDSFDRKTGRTTFHIPMKEASYPFSFYEDRFGVFWIYHVSGSGLATFDRKTRTLTEFSFVEPHSSSPASVGVSGMLEDQNGQLWLSTIGAGVLRFDREGHRFIRYSQKPGDPESLVQNSIRDMFVDREGVIWASLGGYGLTRFTPKPLAFKRYRHDFGNPADRDEPFVGGIYEDDQRVLWIGTRSALHRIDRRTGKFQDFKLTRRESADIIAICQDRAGYLWVGTYNHGLFRFDPRSNRVRRFRHDPGDPHSLSNDIVPRVFIDHSGTLWAATHNGLDRYDAATERFITYRLESPGLHPYYLGMAEDSKGLLWLGTESSGLLRFDPTTGQFTTYQHNPEDRHTLSDNRVNSVHFDRSGTMWVGTQQGLNRFDAKQSTFTNYSIKEGLPGSAVACILEDDDGYLWIGTDNGIAKFNVKTKTVKSYSTADGLPGPDLTGWGTCFRSKSGEMFFGGFSGATAFFPKHVSDNSYTPPVALTDLRLFGTALLPGMGSPLKKAINHTDSITLSHEQNRFSIGFSALSYLTPATNRYRYMLEGLDTHWNEVGSDQRFASYTTLPPGTYTFRVQGATSRGPWSEPGASLRIEVLAAQWNTWSFRAVCIVLFVTLLWGIYQWRVRRLQQEERKLRQTIETIPIGAWIARPDGSNEFVNRHWMEYTGLSATGTANSGWQAALYPEDLDRFVTTWRASVESGMPFENETRFRYAATGEYRWCLVRAVPVRDKGGSILKWYGIATDIEDRKRAEREHARRLQLEADLAHINRVSIMGELAASLSHEIQQPIAGAVLNASVCTRALQRDEPDLIKAREAISRIVRDSKRAADIIDRIRLLYKRASPKRELVNLDEIIADLIILLDDEAKRHSVVVRTEFAETLPKIIADRVQVQQVLMNLMLNAIQAMEVAGGELVIRSQQTDDGKMLISVTDGGVGLPTEKADQIFDPFFTTKSQGSGMGLAISRSIVESHGGRLWASANPTGGTTFHFTLPTDAKAVPV